MKRIFSILCFVNSILLAQIPTSGLVAYYPFNGNANDETGNGHNGTSYGASLTTDRFGNSNAAYYFAGGGERIIIPHSNQLNPSVDGLTISVWCNISSTNPVQEIICKGNDWLNDAYRFRYHNPTSYPGSGLGFAMRRFWSSNIVPSPSINQWIHLIAVYDINCIKIYQDGVLKTTTSITEPSTSFSNTSNLFIAQHDGASYPLGGKIDDIRIYNRVLSDAEIQSLYNEGVSNIRPATPQNLTATNSNTQVTLMWLKNTESDFFKYRIYIGTDSTTMTLRDSSTASISDTSKTITGLANGTKYYFRISALDNDRLESGQSFSVNAIPSNNVIPSNGLLAYYPFNGNANDETGNGHNGTIGSGVTASIDRFGNVNTSYSFSGSGQGIVIPHSSVLNPASSGFSISVWYYMSSSSAVQDIILKGTDVTNYCYRIRYHSSSSYPNTGTGFATSINTGDYGAYILPSPPLNQWIHFVGTFDGTIFKAYQDGVLKATSITVPSSVFTNTSDLYIGAGQYHFGGGKIDDIRIYNRSLSIAEVQSLYIEGVANSTPATPQNLTATAGNGQVILKWNKVSDSDIRTYRVYRNNSSPASTLTDSVATLNDTTKIISGLTQNQTYYFRITAVDSAGQQSNYSSEVSAMPNNVSPVAVNLRDTLIVLPVKQRTISVTYNSTGSTDTDGSIDSVLWYINNIFQSKGTSLTYNYGPGTTNVMMIVKDNNGATDTSTAVVTKIYFKNIFSGPIYSGVSLLSQDVMYAVASGDAIYKMNADGVVDYNLQVSPGEIRSASVGSDGSVYLASLNTNLYAFSNFATAMWPALALGGQATSTPMVDYSGNRIYIGVANRNFLSINRLTGAVTAGFFSDAPIKHSAIMTKDRRLIFSTVKGTVYGVNMNGKSEATSATWTLSAGDSVNTSPAVDNQGYIYFGTTSGKVIKVLMKTNQTPSILWQTNLNSQVTSSPVIDGNGIVYVGTLDGNMNALYTSDGSVKWKYLSSSAIHSTASISQNGLVYFGNDSGILYALNSTGVFQWSLIGSSAITAPLLAHNGLVYFGTNAGELMGIYDGDTHSSMATTNQRIQKAADILPPEWGTYQGNNCRNGIQDSISVTPVELVTFEGKSIGSSVKLNWGTATEINNYGFGIERTLSNSDRNINGNWKSIGFVEGSGTSNSPKGYSFTDKEPLIGKSVYRLRQIDRDGQFQYSGEVELDIANIPTVFSLSQNYPNPFNPSTVISYGLPTASFVTLKIYDVVGREVATLVSNELAPGYYSNPWNASGLSSGIFFYRISAISLDGSKKNSFNQVKKLLLMK